MSISGATTWATLDSVVLSNGFTSSDGAGLVVSNAATVDLSRCESFLIVPVRKEGSLWQWS